MQNPYKKITASLLLFSHMLTSCYNPNLGMGKQALPTPAGPADKQRQYAGEPHDKYPPKPTSHTFTTADKHPITFTYHNGQWQAAIKEYASNDSWQHGQLPVVFEPGLALEDVVDSNPTEQKQLLHLCPSEEDPEQPGYVYVGRAQPSKAPATAAEEPSSKADSASKPSKASPATSNSPAPTRKDKPPAGPGAARPASSTGPTQPCTGDRRKPQESGPAPNNPSACKIQQHYQYRAVKHPGSE